MAQDFAKKKNTNTAPRKKQPARAATRKTTPVNSNHWSWYFSGLFSGLLICVVAYFSLTQLNNGAALNDVANQDTSSEGGDTASTTELDFYEYLPKAEVEVNVVPVEIASVTPSGEPENPASQITYILQAGSFIDPNDAEALRARLILLNLDTRIQTARVSGRTWYRVQAGPFNGRNAVSAAENIMFENNIDPIRMRIPTP